MDNSLNVQYGTLSLWKKDKILSRDDHCCRGCGMKDDLDAYLLEKPLPGFTLNQMPSVMYVTLCPACINRLDALENGSVKDVDTAFDFWCRIYHAGVYAAVQHLKYEI